MLLDDDDWSMAFTLPYVLYCDRSSHSHAGKQLICVVRFDPVALNLSTLRRCANIGTFGYRHRTTYANCYFWIPIIIRCLNSGVFLQCHNEYWWRNTYFACANHTSPPSILTGKPTTSSGFYLLTSYTFCVCQVEATGKSCVGYINIMKIIPK